MFERLLDKSAIPTNEQIREYMGPESYDRLMSLEEYLTEHYDFSKELKFPFGNNYGWGYKYNHKSSHLCQAFVESGAFTVLLQIGDKQIEQLERILPSLLIKTQGLWHNRYPCGETGGWVHYRVLSDEELLDVQKLLNIKRQAKKTRNLN